MKKNIIILGGGVTGSALGYYLSKNTDIPIRIIEKTDYLGGLSKSIWIDKYKCWNDIGPHIFHSPDKEITDSWKELFINQFQVRDYYCAVIKGKRYNEYHPYPISIEGLKKLTDIEVKNVNLSPITNKDQALARNFREMMTSKVGGEIEKMYFREYPKKLWGIPTDVMRSDWAPKRIKIREKIDTFFAGQFVATSKRGAGHFYKKILEEILKNKSSKVDFNTTVKDLNIKDGIIKGIKLDNIEINTENSLIISTLPIPIISGFLGKKMNLKYRGVKITNWLMKTKNILPNNYAWLYFDDQYIPFTRLTDYTKMSPEAIKGKNGILTVECPYTPEIKDKKYSSNHHILEIRQNLNNIPWLKNKVIDCISYFEEPFVYPIRERGFEDELNKFNSLVSSLNNFWSIGAAGGFEYSDAQILFRKAKDFSDDLLHDIKNGTERVINKHDSSVKAIRYKSNIIEKGDYETTKIISEIGINHNGSIDLAKKLIIESKNSGADYVKFQLYTPEKRSAVNMRDAFYYESSDGEGENLKQLLESCNLSFEDIISLKEFSDNIGIEMFVSAFDRECVYKASKLGSKMIKISSMDLTNIEVWESANKYFNNIIASTGMSTLAEVRRSYKYAHNINSKAKITLLHCVSSYPMPIEEANLGRMNMLRSISERVGYSDHSCGIEVPYISSLLGAQIIEKHFTLDKSLNGPDHIHSATPKELEKLSQLIKSTPNIISNKDNGISKIQKKEMMKQKKGYYYKKKLNIGDTLNKKDIKLGAPCLGSDTFECYELIGKQLKTNVQTNEPVKSIHFKIKL